MTGPTYALSNVVMPRSCSRSSGHTWDETATYACGIAAASASAISSSCAGLAHECRKHTATDSGCGARDPVGEFLRRGRIERDAARCPSAFIRSGRLERQGVLERGAYRLEEQVVAILLDASLATEPEEIAEAFGGDEGRAGAAPFEDDVRGERGAMHDAADGMRRKLRLGQRRLQTAPHAHERIVGCRQHLDDVLAAGTVVEHHVGERAADVDADRRRAGH